MFRITGFLLLFPLSRTLGTSKYGVSETESVSVLRCGGQIVPLDRADLNHSLTQSINQLIRSL
jgi:hypothetical protein